MAEEKLVSPSIELPTHVKEEHIVQLSPRDPPTKVPLPRSLDATSEHPFLKQLLHVTERLHEFGIDYTPEAVTHKPEELEIAVTYDKRGGARWRSLRQYVAGRFSAKIKTPAGNTSGLNCSFYLSSLEGDKKQDEIDFEFLGKDKSIVQTNFYSKGVGGREVLHDLGFDTSAEFHEYTISWFPSKIEWHVDGLLIRSANREADNPFPEKPMYLYASVWNAGDIDEGRWAGCYAGSDEPYTCVYKNVVVPLCNLDETS